MPKAANYSDEEILLALIWTMPAKLTKGQVGRILGIKSAGQKHWRGKTLAGIRKIIHEADPGITEEWKWMGSPCWYHDGLVCVANAHKEKVKLTFYSGASLPDPDKIFNNGLGGNKWRAIDYFEGDKVNGRALKNAVRAAVAYNQAKPTGNSSGIRKK